MRNKDEIELAVVIEKVITIDKKIDDLKTIVTQNYVTRDELATILKDVDYLKKIVFGFVGLLLLTFGTIVVNFFLRSP